MLHIGYHESLSEGFLGLGKEALSVGADTFAFFTRNPRGGQAKPIDKIDVENLCKFMVENNFVQPVAHAPYTMNPCSANEGLREYAFEMMKDDLVRLSNIPNCLYNFHPGSHTGQGSDVGISLTAKMISDVISDSETSEGVFPGGTKLLIETMAGKGSEIGKTFEEVKQIIDAVENTIGKSSEKLLGVCLDTCHIWDGGYDIRDADKVIGEFDKIIGLKRLSAIHLNDSMNELNSHKDRHAKLGEGKIGFDTLYKFINKEIFTNLPFILETPNDHDGYKKEIEMINNK